MKIGIITHYFGSKNYGGNLQAYALVEFLSKQGYIAEQISYNRANDNEKYNKEEIKTWKKLFKKVIKKFQYIARKCFFAFLKNRSHQVQNRNGSIDKFNQSIPHSAQIYNLKKINDIKNKYDVFIVGSDQVWHPAAICSAYLLNFDIGNGYKISYAASLGGAVLTERQKQLFSESLKTYDAISVREESSVGLIQPLTKTKVEWVLDPTLLLSSEDWNRICTPRRVSDKYVFCYFLGGIARYRKIVKQFAKAKKLKIVTLPYLGGALVGENFGDYRLFDVSPADFISLIKNAEYVFTDSFHATVFSHIYHKNFFVFNRAGLKSMNDRIYSLISLFNTQDRFCDTKAKISLKYIESLPPIDYNKEFLKFEEQKEKSIKFLRENLGKAKQKLKND